MRIDPSLLNDGMSPAEIAKELNLSVTNVHSIIQRALTKLRLKLIAQEADKRDYV